MDFNRYTRAVCIMKKLIYFCLFSLVVVSCSKKEEPLPAPAPAYIVENLESSPYYADTLLLQKFDKYKMTLSGESKTIRPIELEQQKTPQSKDLLEYLCLGMTSGKYELKDNKISVDIIQFADEILAYGFYSSMRPNGITIEKIGAESFQHGQSRYMVKSFYVLICSAENESSKSDSILKDYAIEVSNNIHGSQATPPFFLLFPYKDKIIPSTKFYNYQFLGIPGFNEVYTTSYSINGETMLFFLTMDKSRDKFKYLRQYAKQTENVVESFHKYAFDSTYSIAFKDSTNGVIVAGIISDKLIGTIKYNPKIAESRLRAWIKSLSQ